MRKVSIDKLWDIVNMIDSVHDAIKAEKFIREYGREYDLSFDVFDDLMMAIADQYRFFNKMERA